MWRTRFATLLVFLFLFSSDLLAVSSEKHESTRQAFLKLIDRPRVPLAPSVAQLSQSEGLEQWHFTFAADASQRVTGLLVKQSNLKTQQPAVIVLHGTGGNKEGQLPLLKELAGKGFTAVAIDGRYHGERAAKGARSAEYVDAILRTWRTGEEHPFLYDTVWDLMRLIDYLETRKDVDPPPDRNDWLFQRRHGDLSGSGRGPSDRRRSALHRRAELSLGS